MQPKVFFKLNHYSMKFLLTISALILAASTFGQKPATVSPLKSMVETEQAFSRAAEDKSTREAFMLFIADDGILFRPTAVKGKQWLLEHPPTPSDKRSLLAWQPLFADISRAGDLGYTTGPWEFKNNIKDSNASAYGDFVTVWKRQPDGKWKFALDLGISHPQSSGPLRIWSVSAAGGSNSTRGGTVALDGARNALVNREREFASATSKLGHTKPFDGYAMKDVRVYRQGNNPFVGKDSALKVLATEKGIRSSDLTGEGVSDSADLGYTYGTYETRSDGVDKKVIEHGNYLRIWKKDDGVWKVVLDVANPV